MWTRATPLVLVVGLLSIAVVGLTPGCKHGDDAAATPKKVNLLVFSNYIPDVTYADFEAKTGIKVEAGVIGSNEELLGKMRANTADYDLVCASDYMIKRLVDLKLLAKLDRTKLSNFKNLNHGMLGKPYDPQNEYCVPFFWGTTGLGFNKLKAPQTDSWSVVFDPKYKGKVSMLQDARELLSVALRVDGKDPNTRNKSDMDAAIEKLRKQRQEVEPLYDSDTFDAKLAAGDVAIAQGFSGQLAKVVAESKGTIDYVIPKEGGTLWIDNLAIPAKSGRSAAALAFIDYLMDEGVAADTANFSGYASPNRAAFPRIKDDLRNNKIVYPTADVLERCKTLDELGESNRMVDDAIEKIRQ